MARNTKPQPGIVSIDDLEGGAKESKENAKALQREVTKGADLQTGMLHKKGGRKKKDVKANIAVRVYVTEDQKTALEAYCERIGTSESVLIKQLLVEKGVF